MIQIRLQKKFTNSKRHKLPLVVIQASTLKEVVEMLLISSKEEDRQLFLVIVLNLTSMLISHKG
jgi:hypothetical protein